ncbi:MAG TPA: cyclase family protein [Pyrinomonadaceae bacterium]|nr:cyclase family protein [Pyrinomonadaceae bacterium]
MSFYDITIPLTNEMPTYPGDPGIQIRDWYSLAAGHPANVTHLSLGAHTGTHVDAPAHFIEGAGKVDSLELNALIGPAQLIDVPKDLLSVDRTFVAERLSSGIKRVLFKTRNSTFWNEDATEFRQDFTYLEFAAAKYLVDHGVQLVGIDYLSIEQFGQKQHETHLALLSHGVVILEGLALAAVPEGLYELICLPMRIRSGKGDGSPARAVLRTLE